MAKHCFTTGCENVPQKSNKYCSKCKSRNYKRKNLMRYTYLKLMSNAIRRGIPFNLTYAHWELFCKATNYLELKGLELHSLNVDRIDINKGYVDGNIQALTMEQNLIKYRKVDLLKKSWGSGRQVGDPF